MGRLKKGIRLTIIFIFAIGYSLTNAQQSVPRFEPGECPFQTDKPLEGVECGKLIVYENRDDPAEGMLRLAVATLRSFSDNPFPDPLVFLSGGPGNPAVTLTPSRATSDFWNRYRETRDIVFFDQRGTGYSDPTFCPELNLVFTNVLYQGLTPREVRNRQITATKECYDKMQAKGVDFSAYNSATSAQDLDDLRKVLGYDRWNLLGVSYGTRLALTAMRDHPAGIRSIILDSTSPPNVRKWVKGPSDFNRSLRLVFDQCAADSACRDAYPKLESNFYAIIDSLKHQPIKLAMDDTTRFSGGRLVLDDALFLGGMFRGLYFQNFIPLLPLLVQETKSGNFDVWKVLAEQLARDPHQISRGLQRSIHCYETAPFNPQASVDSARARYARLAPFDETFNHHHAICDAWHNVRADSLEFRPVRSDIPTLIFSGEFDPTTPPYYGQIASKTLPNSTFVKAPALGHGVAPSTTCTQDLMEAFLETPSQLLDTSCVDSLPKASFVTDLYINSGVSTFAQKIQQGPYIAGLGLISLILFSGLLFWPVAYLIRRFRNKTRVTNRLQVSARWISALASVAAIILLAGLALAIGDTASQNPMILAFGLPLSFSWLFWLPYVVTILAVGALIYSVFAWKSKWWSTAHRVHYTLITVACIGLITFISVWELW